MDTDNSRTTATILTKLICSLLLCASAQASPTRPVLRIAAASSFTAALEALSQTFQKQENVKIQSTLAASGLLYGQIRQGAQLRQGAPYAVFLPADRELAQQLVAAGQAEGLRVFARGRLALFGLQLKDLDALHTARSVALPNPRLAPLGRAAEQVLGRFKEIKAKRVYANSAQQGLLFAETGAADLALVGWGQALGYSGKGRFVALPEGWHAPIELTAVRVKRAQETEAERALAQRFVDFLASPVAKGILQSQHYEPL